MSSDTTTIGIDETVEMLTQGSPSIERNLWNTALSELDQEFASDAEVSLFATVKDGEQESKPISIPPIIPAAHLYHWHKGPSVEMMLEVLDLCQSAEKIAEFEEGDIEAELRLAEFWVGIGQLKKYLAEITDVHDELIAILDQVRQSEKKHIFSKGRIDALSKFLRHFSGLVQIKRSVLDAGVDLLEESGFDIGFP